MFLKPSPQELFDELCAHSESARIETKAGSAIGPSVMQTICAFANEPGLDGGYLLLGVSEQDKHFVVTGVDDVDHLLQELSNNCRTQFERPLSIEASVETLQGKNVVVVYVPELLPASKPCVFEGRFHKANKKKTGIWRRGPNGDYECSQEELEPILLAKTGKSFEEVIFDDAEYEDIDPQLIDLYRKLRAKKNPQASELSLNDFELLRVLRLIRKNDKNQWQPNVACLLLFGSQVALRRLMPMERVDFIRIVGTRWIEDPNSRFSSLDFRESLLTLIPKVEATILDTLLKQFQLQEGELQRTDVPVLPQRVVREAIVNAVMHRDYRVHSPTQVVRYSDRIEIYNAGYSLKPVEELGTGASELRNPILASILYDLSFAETKGSGIRTIRTLLREANLEEPSFVSNVTGNSFWATYSLNQLMSKEDLLWLGQFKGYELNDNEARALLIAKNLGAVNNATLREDTNQDTLQASHVLQRLSKEYDLLVKHGAGTATTYTLNWTRLQAIGLRFETPHLEAETSHLGTETSHLRAETSHLGAETLQLRAETSHLGVEASHFSVLSKDLEQAISDLGYRPKKSNVYRVILRLCLQSPRTSDALMSELNRGRQLIKNYLKDMRMQDMIEYVYPEIPNHPYQAYRVTEYGKKWLESSNE